MSVFLLRLKQETLPQHIAIEHQIDLKHLCGSLSVYTAHLARLYGFYQPLEDLLWCTNTVRETGPTQVRRKTPLLQRDLQALGVEPETLPRCHALPPLADDAQAMGCLYVLEGASLGGQVITRLVQNRLSITPETGGAFFYGYGNDTTAMWDGFRASLEEFANSPERQDTIIRSARATFGTLGDWLDLSKRKSNG